MQVQWYPGHMTKAKRMLEENLSLVDVVLEIVDARVPFSSRNPDLAKLCANKKRLVVFNKADLADANMMKAVLAECAKQGETAVAITATHAKEVSMLMAKAEWVARDLLQKAASKGMRKTLRLLVAGVPNSGKSTLINSLCRTTVARTGDKAGVTRGKQWVKVSTHLEVLDSPGLLWPKLHDQDAALKLAFVGCVNDDALGVEDLARALLSFASANFPKVLFDRYKLTAEDLDQETLLERICQKRGYLISGGQADTLRGARAVLDEMRGGKWGRLTLDRLPQEQENGQ